MREIFYGADENSTQNVRCDYCGKDIDCGLCIDIQMIANGFIKESALSDLKIEKERANEICQKCAHRLSK